MASHSVCLLLLFIACLGNIASITRAARVVAQEPGRHGFPGSVELMQRTSPDGGSDIDNRQVRSSQFNKISAGIASQNYYTGDNRNNINYYRRSRVNAEFATASPAQAQAQDEVELVPVSVATTATKTVQQLNDGGGDDNHNHDGGDSSSSSSSSSDSGQVVDKRKLLLSNLHLFNGTDTKNLTDSQKMLLIQIADRVARYGENNLFRELVNAQHQQKEGQAQEEGRANTKPDSLTTTVTKSKAKPSKRPHSAVHSSGAPSAATLSSAAPSKASSSSSSSSTGAATTTTTTTKRQPLPAGADSTVSVAPTKTTTKAKIRPNTSFTPSPVVSSPVTPSVASTASFSTPSEAAAEKKSTTAATSRHTKKPPVSVEDIIYDYNVTASALIESLSKPNPTSNSLLYQQTMHPAAAGTGNNKQSVNSDGKVSESHSG